MDPTPLATRNRFINPVTTRAALYGLIAFLTPVAGVVVETTKGGVYPDGVSLLGAAASGTLALLVTLRAFIDGTIRDEELKK